MIPAAPTTNGMIRPRDVPASGTGKAPHGGCPVADIPARYAANRSERHDNQHSNAPISHPKTVPISQPRSMFRCEVERRDTTVTTTEMTMAALITVGQNTEARSTRSTHTRMKSETARPSTNRIAAATGMARSGAVPPHDALAQGGWDTTRPTIAPAKAPCSMPTREQTEFSLITYPR